MLAITGVDCAAQFRGEYSTAAGALKTMKAAGFDNLADLVATMLPEIHPSQAHIGDIAAIPHEGPFGYALGVVNGERIFVLRETGLGTVGLLDAKRAFRSAKPGNDAAFFYHPSATCRCRPIGGAPFSMRHSRSPGP